MENTAKNFALQLGSLVALYVSIVALINLLLSAVTIIYPDTAQMPYEYMNASSSIRYGIAMLVVFFPTYIVLTRLVNKIRRTESGVYLTLTKWLMYFSLLIGGGVLLGDLVVILLGFLNGELTIRFVLKAISVFLVVGTAFGYYLLDARGYWHTHERESILYGVVVSVLVIVAIVFGYTKIETPAQVREMNIDRTMVNDLGQIQSQIQTYTQLHGTLPTSIIEAYNGLEMPVAPKGRTEYSYTILDGAKFKLCAEFAYPTPKGEYPAYTEPYSPEPMFIKNPNDWNHAKGTWCFERIVSDAPNPMKI